MKALVLAKSGFGKSTSIGEIPELGLKGLDPKITYLIVLTNPYLLGVLAVNSRLQHFKTLLVVIELLPMMQKRWLKSLKY